jgi:hypothetical protein
MYKKPIPSKAKEITIIFSFKTKWLSNKQAAQIVEVNRYTVERKNRLVDIDDNFGTTVPAFEIILPAIRA